MALPGPVAQSVVNPIADPGIVSWIPAQPHTFEEIDHEVFSTVHFCPYGSFSYNS